jgi:hypothetical protein
MNQFNCHCLILHFAPEGGRWKGALIRISRDKTQPCEAITTAQPLRSSHGIMVVRSFLMYVCLLHFFS